MSTTHKGYKITDHYATYFLTFTVVGWIDLFTRPACKAIVVEALKYAQIHKGLVIYAYVIMGSHIHIVAAASDPEHPLYNIIGAFKSYTSKQLVQWVTDNPKESRRHWLLHLFKYYATNNKRNTTYQIWRQDNQPKRCLYPGFTMQKIDYTHNNPVIEGIVEAPIAYLHSSAGQYAGLHSDILKVEVLDFGTQIGHVHVLAP